MTMNQSIENMCRLCLDTTEPKIVLEDEQDNELLAAIEAQTNLKLVKEIYQAPALVLLPQICVECYGQVHAIVQFRNTCLSSNRRIRSLIDDLLMIESDESAKCETVDDGLASLEHSHDDLQIEILEENEIELLVDALEESGNGSGASKVDDKSAMDSEADGRERKPFKRQKKDRKSYSIPCEVCGKLYTKGDMKFHLNLHNGIRPYVCGIDDCAKAFSSPFLLGRHKKVTHSDVKRYECEICGKMFKHSSVLKFHRSYHGDPQMPCDICGKMMRNERALKKHMMVHTGERPHQCEVCKKCFQTAYTLRTHQRVHTNEKPYVCSYCGQAYAYNCLLKAHTEKNHLQDAGET